MCSASSVSKILGTQWHRSLPNGAHFPPLSGFTSRPLKTGGATVGHELGSTRGKATTKAARAAETRACLLAYAAVLVLRYAVALQEPEGCMPYLIVTAKEK
jgi:hypothetical protein